MGHASHPSRREILNAIPVLTSGSLLLPLRGQTGSAPLGVIRGALREGGSGRPIAAKLRVTNLATGEVCMPAACIKTMPKRTPEAVRYFYARGSYELGGCTRTLSDRSSPRNLPRTGQRGDRRRVWADSGA